MAKLNENFYQNQGLNLFVCFVYEGQNETLSCHNLTSKNDLNYLRWIAS